MASTSTVILLLTMLRLSDCFEFSNKTMNTTYPHALFYRADPFILKVSAKKKFLGELDLNEVIEMETFPSEENATSSEVDFTTDSLDYGTSTEYSNVTEISVFPNQPEESTTEAPRKTTLEKTTKDAFCHCDLTFHSCDINCCCDSDCTEAERLIFLHCLETPKAPDIRYCYSQIFYYKNNTARKVSFQTDNLFCILKDNLPDKKNTEEYKKITDSTEAEILIEDFYKWPDKHNYRIKQIFKGKPYGYGDPIWSMEGTNVAIFDIPSSNINHYCDDRTSIKFMKNVDFNCIVKIADLEMFNIYRNLSQSLLISIPEKNLNDELDIRNCSSVSCVPWTLLVCDYQSCEPYNQTTHSPSCNDSECINIVTRLQYVLHCYTSKIAKAEIYLYTKTISLETAFIKQEISVTYYLEKENDTQLAVELSGNPGYIIGKPVITSRLTDDSISKTFQVRNTIRYPKNEAGLCVLSNSTYNDINFGYNIKSKCRHIYTGKLESNATLACNLIQNDLYKFLKIDSEKMLISPLGNPSVASNEDWLELILDKVDSKLIHGEFQDIGSLVCHNLVSTMSYEFTYANVSLTGVGSRTDRKILRCILHYRESETVEFNLEDGVLIMITTSVMFFDITKPAHYEYAKGPHLHIHLPSDFFYPFTSNASVQCKCVNFIILLLELYILMVY